MTALPVLAVGAVPVFADVAHPATFALDVADVAGKFTPRTKAVIAVPMWGYPADGPELARACCDWGVPLVEDAAQAHGTSLSGRYAGTQGAIGAFSTHARKLICTGEGGFCLTSDPALADQLRQLRTSANQPAAASSASDSVSTTSCPRWRPRSAASNSLASPTVSPGGASSWAS